MRDHGLMFLCKKNQLEKLFILFLPAGILILILILILFLTLILGNMFFMPVAMNTTLYLSVE